MMNGMTTSSGGYFEVALSPRRKVKPVEPEVEERPVLTLKPFAAKPQICFKKVLVNTEVIKTLYIFNPDNTAISVDFLSIPPPERRLELSVTGVVVEPKSEVALQIRWCPKEVGTWFDTLTTKDSKGRRCAVSISYESVAPKQPRGAKKVVRRRPSVAVSPKSARLPVRPAVKSFTKPQRRIPEPKPREIFKPAPVSQNTWFDGNAAKDLIATGLPPTPFRRETYTVQDGNNLRNSSENKENCASPFRKATALPGYTVEASEEQGAHSSESPTYTVSRYQRGPFTPISVGKLPRSSQDPNISTDSLDVSPLKTKPRSKVLAMLEADFAYSPVVSRQQRPQQEEIQISIQEDFLFEKNSFDPEFMQSNIASFNEMSFANRRCSTAFKQLEKKHYDVSPRLRVSPRELFETSRERRLSSDTYVLSASNSLEGASAESMIAQGSTPQRLSRVPEVSEQAECTDFEWSTRLRDRKSKQCLQLTVLSTCVDQISGIELQESIQDKENDGGTACGSESMTAEQVEAAPEPRGAADISVHATFDISPPAKQQPEASITAPYQAVRSRQTARHENATFDMLPAKPQAVKSAKQCRSETNACDASDINGLSQFMQISPPKPFRVPQVDRSREASTSNADVKDATYNVKSSGSTVQNKTYDVFPASSAKNNSLSVPFGLPKALTLETLTSSSKNLAEHSLLTSSYQDGEQIHDPDLFLFEYAFMDATAPGMKKDPFHMNPMLHDAWLEKCDTEFKKWLNAVLTPPEELDTVEVAKVNAADLWARSTRTGANEQLAPSRELVSSRYLAIKSRLDQLRHAALALFRQPEIAEILCKVTARVDSSNIKMRSDKALHLDQGLKQHVLSLFLNYNPLWLRLGLETVVGRTIPLESNSDLHGLSNFIVNRVLSVEGVVGKSHLVLKAQFREKFNRFVLKKFLLLVYFLDQAKTRKLIRHDPCLFRKNSEIKTSKDMLLSFSRLLLAGEGDLTKHLSYMGYTVSHKQGFLDEFNYSVTRLGGDLRDGVRITRVVELVTGTSGQSVKLRVPPVSRLQKIHNVEVALKGLAAAGYAVQNVTAADVVGGHREKTLSMLWQIVHNFQAPRFEKASKVIQNWWLRPSLKTEISRRMYRRKRDKAVVVLQKYIRGYLCRKNFEAFKEAARAEKLQREMACVIQRNCRIFILRRRVLRLAKWNEMNNAAKIIQSNVRRFLAMKRLQEFRLQAHLQWTAKREASALKIQCFWRRILATRVLLQLKLEDEEKKNIAAQKLQGFFRCIQAKKILLQFQSEARREAATLVLQCAWRCHLAKQALQQIKIEHEEKREKCALMIQCAWRSYRARKVLKFLQQEEFKRRTNNAATIIQCLWRCYSAKKILNALKEEKMIHNTAALNIQCAWRSYVARQELRKLRNIHQLRLEAAIKIQCAWKCSLARKVRQELEKKRNAAALVLQNSWRCFIARQTLATLRAEHEMKLQVSATIIQCAWRRVVAKNMLARLRVENEVRRNAAALKVQCLWRCFVARRTLSMLKTEFESKTNAAVTLQCSWRSFVARKELYVLKQGNEARRNAAVLVLQCAWRCFKSRQTLVNLRTEFKTQEQAVLTLQCAWRCYVSRKVLCVLQQEKEEKRDAATLVLQSAWRCFVARRTLLNLRAEYELKCKIAAIQIQCSWRCFVARKTLKQLKQENRNLAAVKIQCMWRCYRARQALMYLQQKHNEKIMASTIIQCAWRCFVAKQYLLALKKEEERHKHSAAQSIQCWWRCMLAKNTLQQLKNNYEQTRCSAATKIQCLWRKYLALQLLKLLKQELAEKKENAAVKIQCSWRCFRARSLLAKLKYDQEQKKETAAVKIQCAWRCVIARRIRHQLKEEVKWSAAITIQCCWRVYSARKLVMMQKQKKQIESNKQQTQQIEKETVCAVVIQRAFRRWLWNKTQLFLNYEKKHAVFPIHVLLQWEEHLLQGNDSSQDTLIAIFKQLRHSYEKQNHAARIIQCYWLRFMHKRHCAATKLQAVWRGYVCRRNNMRAAQAGKPIVIEVGNKEQPLVIQAKLVVERHQRIQEATRNTNDEDRIDQKIARAFSSLGKTLGHDIYAMCIFEKYLTISERCVPLILPSLGYIVNLLLTNNRSVPTMEAAHSASGALLSLAKHPFSQPDVWQCEEIIETLLFSLTISKDTYEKVFLNACTSLWLMARDPAMLEKIKNQDKLGYRLQNLSRHIQGRERTKVAERRKMPLPSLRFNKKPYCFCSRLQGLHLLMRLLGITIPTSKTK